MPYDYNPIDDAESVQTEAEKLANENWKLRLKMIDAYIILKECIDLAELGTNTFLLNKLKSIKL